MIANKATVCRECGTTLPAGINFREVWSDDGETFLGNRCYNKCRKNGQVVELTPDDVKAHISPADPDTLIHVGGNVFEAKWNPYGSPFLDTDIIKRSGAKIVQELRRAEEPYGWMVLRFKLEAVAESEELE